MNYHIEIENLGAIEKAEFEISPMTILAGKNGTGKSFVTKFLYSVLNSININTVKNSLEKISFKNHKILLILSEHNQGQIQKTLFSLSNFFFNIIHSPMSETLATKIENKLEELLNIEDKINQELSAEDKRKIFLRNNDIDYIVNTNFLDLIKENTKKLIFACRNINDYYISQLEEVLTNQIKENFQISELNQLVNLNKEQCVFTITDYLSIKIKNNKIELDVQRQTEIKKLVFFESPVYWKLSTFIFDYINDDILTGIPRHFHDLRKLLFTNFKNGERPQFIINCANNLEQSLQGKFRTTLGSDLVFENKQGQAIDKSLVSFGMTNLGILQAVLNKNIINTGSFIFIDEPESNLHPEWQTLLAETLVYLAKNGVYVIITSHSTDMLKAFDVATQEQKLEDKLSAHYFQMDGTLLAMNDKNLTEIEQARQKLMENYDDLTMRGYLL